MADFNQAKWKWYHGVKDKTKFKKKMCSGELNPFDKHIGRRENISTE